jgi:hypothetical protein
MRRSLRMALGFGCVAALTSCFGTVGVSDDMVVDGYPPDGYLATTTPVYFEGHASYWYGNRWFYRDGGGWRGYRSEPAGLRESRVRAAPSRQYYGRAHAGGYRRR